MAETYETYKLLGFKRKFKLTKLSPPQAVIDLFSLCTNKELQMSPDHFRRFLIEFQGDKDVTVDYAKGIMEQALHQLRPDFAMCCFTVDDFFNFLFLDEFNGPINLEVRRISNCCYLYCLRKFSVVASFELRISPFQLQLIVELQVEVHKSDYRPNRFRLKPGYFGSTKVKTEFWPNWVALEPDFEGKESCLTSLKLFVFFFLVRVGFD
ncbi:putative phosphoinositide phospholipase C [Helianthus anomalus]